jgi:glycosyltransferase involved in cell wall biosynthesis
MTTACLPPARALFVNTGLAGHRTFGRLMQDVARRIPGLTGRHIDLSDGLTPADRMVRRLLSLPLAPTAGPMANLDLRRWRQETNVGLLAVRRIAQARRAEPFDVVHFYTQPAAYGSVALMRLVPSIVCLDCTQRQASLEAASAISRATYRASILHDGFVFRAASAVVATSDWAARDLIELYPECASRVDVLPCPVDLAAFDPRWAGERSARARTPGHRPRFLFIGGDFPRKGGLDLLDAWRTSNLADVAALDIVTDWSVPAPLPPGVNLIGGVASYSDTWRELWRRADAFVMPSRHEAFGIVYEEAAASALPAVGTRINAVPEIIQDGVTGLLVASGDRAGLIRALEALVRSADLREQMGRAARQRIEQRAALPVYAGKLEAIIAKVLTSHVRQLS